MGLGKYTSWPEDKRIEWLTSELMSQRPLYHRGTFRCNEDVQEVLTRFHTISTLSRTIDSPLNVLHRALSKN